jgi:hypothetical protein
LKNKFEFLKNSSINICPLGKEDLHIFIILLFIIFEGDRDRNILISEKFLNTKYS